MKRKKLILSESSLIDLICKTVLEVSNINEAMGDALNPLESDKDLESDFLPHNSYLGEAPDQGWKEFWSDFNGEMSDEEFKTKYKDKTRDDFRKDIKDEVDSVKDDAIKHYMDLYSPKSEEFLRKLRKQLKNWRVDEYAIADDVQEFLKSLYSDSSTRIHYSLEDNPPKAQGDDMKNTYAYVWPSVIGDGVYAMNIYKWMNPTLGSWREQIKNTTVHEIGHLLQHELERLGVDWKGGETLFTGQFHKIKERPLYLKGGDIDFDNPLRELLGMVGNYEDDTPWDGEMWKEVMKEDKDDGVWESEVKKYFPGYTPIEVERAINELDIEEYFAEGSENHVRIQALRRFFGFTHETGRLTTKDWINMWMDKVKKGSITLGDVKQDKTFFIPKEHFPEGKLMDGNNRWQYVCDIQQFLWSQNYRGIGTIVEYDGQYGARTKKGQEVCDGDYGTNTRAAVKKFYRNMWSVEGTDVVITIPTEMIKYQSFTDGFDAPKSEDDIYDLTKYIWYDGIRHGDVGMFFAYTASDKSGKVLGPYGYNYKLYLDFKKLAEANDTWVGIPELNTTYRDSV